MVLLLPCSHYRYAASNASRDACFCQKRLPFCAGTNFIFPVFRGGAGVDPAVATGLAPVFGADQVSFQPRHVPRQAMDTFQCMRSSRCLPRPFGVSRSSGPPPAFTGPLAVKISSRLLLRPKLGAFVRALALASEQARAETSSIAEPIRRCGRSPP